VATRPHLLGIDDGPFEKRQSEPVPLVAALLEADGPLEAVSISAFPVDGDGATEFLADWVSGMRSYATVQGLVLGGITLAGLGIVDAPELAARLDRPVLVVNRRDPVRSRLRDALSAAGLQARIAIVDRTPPAERVQEGLYLSCAGVSREQGAAWLEVSRSKALLPEPLRIAHLFARALVRGESRGRV